MSKGEWIRNYILAALVAGSVFTWLPCHVLEAQSTGPYVLRTGSTSTGRQIFAGDNGQVNLPPGTFPPFPVAGDLQAISGLGIWQYDGSVWHPIGYATQGVYACQDATGGATITGLNFAGGLTLVTSGITATVSPTYGVSPSTICQGNDTRLSNARTPTAHAPTHLYSGTDQVTLDLLAPPTDITRNNASTSAHGLMQKYPGGMGTFLRADGNFASVTIPTTLTLNGFVQGDSSNNTMSPTGTVSTTSPVTTSGGLFPTNCATNSICYTDNHKQTQSIANGASGTVLLGQGPGAVPIFGASPGFAHSYDSGQQTISSGGGLTLTHGLGGVPSVIVPVLHCTTADSGYSVGDELYIGPEILSDSGAFHGVAVYFNSTTIGVRFSSNATVFDVFNKGTGAASAASNANWAFIIRAYR